MTRSIDWRTVLLLPPKRRFSAAELQRAASERASRTLRVTVASNLVVWLGLAFIEVGRRHLVLYGLLIVLPALGFVLAGSQAWRNPGGRAARWSYWLLPAITGALAS